MDCRGAVTAWRWASFSELIIAVTSIIFFRNDILYFQQRSNLLQSTMPVAVEGSGKNIVDRSEKDIFQLFTTIVNTDKGKVNINYPLLFYTLMPVFSRMAKEILRVSEYLQGNTRYNSECGRLAER